MPALASAMPTFGPPAGWSFGPPPSPSAFPLNPTTLTGLRPDAPSPLPGAPPNPFMGNPHPGAFTTPAPFNPLLAQILLGPRGFGPHVPRGGIMPRGPMGALTPEPERPRSRAANPYRS